MATPFISIRSNLGNKLASCRRGIAEISRLTDTSITKISSFYETEPHGVNDPSNWFINAVCEIKTSKSPQMLLQDLLDVEKRFGRVREDNKYSPRNIDLDLLLYDDQIIDSDFLRLPHPRMHLRRFVLEPLVEIAPDSFHPVLKKTAKELLTDLKDNGVVKKISD